MPGLARYLRTNWGAPFILTFIVLLVASAGLLSAGRSSTANNVAVYALYVLVLDKLFTGMMCKIDARGKQLNCSTLQLTIR
ncbi:MAG: hypothetical protein ABSE82_11790 [Nitrososphaerales archaeon]